MGLLWAKYLSKEKEKKITDEILFEELIGSTVSVLLDTKQPNKVMDERYYGVLMGTTENFIVLNLLASQRGLDDIYIRKNKIISIWKYKE